MTTQYTPYAAFGTAFIHCKTTAGDTREVKLGDNGFVLSGYYFYTDGEVECVVKDTGEKLENRKAGWLNIENTQNGAKGSGTLLVTPLVDSEWFCIGRDLNKSRGLPNLQSVILQSGEQTMLPKDTNFFLAKGVIMAGTKNFVGPCQVRVRTADTTIKNDTQNTVYGLIVTEAE